LLCFLTSVNVSVFMLVKLVKEIFLSFLIDEKLLIIGVQIGNACWELYCLEHGIEADGTFSKERDSSHIISKITMIEY
jgi:hypothetical protein